MFGFGEEVASTGDTNVTQDLGAVSIPEGRLLSFPNTIQNRLAPFSLLDNSKPGHFKFLELFLIDPNLLIISSANVPPQREDWWKD